MHPSPAAALLAELVRIDSRSPGRLGDPRSDGAPTEEALARFLSAHLEQLGMTVELQWLEPGRPHLVARSPQIPGAPTLAIARTTTNTVVVFWLSPSAGFTLQQNTNSVSSVNWSNVLDTPADDGTTKTVIVNPPTGNRFYRLFQP